MNLKFLFFECVYCMKWWLLLEVAATACWDLATLQTIFGLENWKKSSYSKLLMMTFAHTFSLFFYRYSVRRPGGLALNSDFFLHNTLREVKSKSLTASRGISKHKRGLLSYWRRATAPIGTCCDIIRCRLKSRPPAKTYRLRPQRSPFANQLGQIRRFKQFFFFIIFKTVPPLKSPIFNHL